ncbi:hypothetical protein HanOQP8_Chr05g0179811 [Helianthus annuus]|nr:hypothetical protein HanOQP8_Chr05g0179811 [Helianthus annuus]
MSFHHRNTTSGFGSKGLGGGGFRVGRDGGGRGGRGGGSRFGGDRFNEGPPERVVGSFLHRNTAGGFGSKGRGGGGFRVGRDGGGRGGRGGGGRFGGDRFNEGPPERVVEVSSFVHACEGDALRSSLMRRYRTLMLRFVFRIRLRLVKLMRYLVQLMNSSFLLKCWKGL